MTNKVVANPTITSNYLQDCYIDFYEPTSNGFSKIEVNLATDQNFLFNQFINDNIYSISGGFDYITKRFNKLMLLGYKSTDDNYTINILHFYIQLLLIIIIM